MSSLRIQSAKAIFWLTAMFVAAQPVLSFSCPCNCRLHSKVIAAEQNACSCCSRRGRCESNHRHSQGSTAASQLLPAGTVGHCPCAKDCACWILHEASVGMIPNLPPVNPQSLGVFLFIAAMTSHEQVANFKLSVMNLTLHHNSLGGTAAEISHTTLSFQHLTDAIEAVVRRQPGILLMRDLSNTCYDALLIESVL